MAQDKQKGLKSKLSRNLDLVITCYSTLKKLILQVEQTKIQFARVIMDEAHAIKNVTTIGNKLCRQLVPHVPSKIVWFVSGKHNTIMSRLVASTRRVSLRLHIFWFLTPGRHTTSNWKASRRACCLQQSDEHALLNIQHETPYASTDENRQRCKRKATDQRSSR